MLCEECATGRTVDRRRVGRGSMWPMRDAADEECGQCGRALTGQPAGSATRKLGEFARFGLVGGPILLRRGA